MTKEAKIYKEISVVPTPYSPNAVYYVRAGVGVDIYVANSTGTAVHKHNAGAQVAFETLTADPVSPIAGLAWLIDTRVSEEGEYYSLGNIGSGEVATSLRVNTTNGIKEITLK